MDLVPLQSLSNNQDEESLQGLVALPRGHSFREENCSEKFLEIKVQPLEYVLKRGLPMEVCFEKEEKNLHETRLQKCEILLLNE